MKAKFMRLATLSLVLVLVLAACGTGGGDTGVEEAEQEEEQEQETADEKVTLTLTSWRTNQLEHDVYDQVLEEFNKLHPNIEIDFQPVKSTEYDTTLNTTLKTDSAADIIHLRPYLGTQNLADAGYLEPIDDIDGLDVFTENDLMAAQGSDGKQYGVPYMLSTTQIFYNKSIFDEYDLQVPETWDELLENADILKENGVTPFAFGSKEAWVLTLMHGAIAPQFYGLDFPEKLENGETQLDSPEFVESIEAFNELSPYFPDNYTGLDMDDIRTMFATEQTAMVINGSFEIRAILDMNPDLEMGIFPVPPVDADGEPTITTWTDGSFGINAKSENKEAAKKYLEFMSTTDFGNIVLNTSLTPTPVPDATTDDPIMNEIVSLSSTNGSPYLAVTYLNGGNPTAKSTLEAEMQSMFLDEVTPKDVAEEAQKILDAWLDEQE